MHSNFIQKLLIIGICINSFDRKIYNSEIKIHDYFDMHEYFIMHENLKCINKNNNGKISNLYYILNNYTINIMYVIYQYILQSYFLMHNIL